ELAFVDAHDFGRPIQPFEDLAGGGYHQGRHLHVRMADDMVFGVPRVHARLEDLDLLAGDLGPADAAGELLALPAEHAAGDDPDPAGVRVAGPHRANARPVTVLPNLRPDVAGTWALLDALDVGAAGR